MEHLSEKEKEALKMFKERLLKEFPDQVTELKLFGSKARGEAAKHSDVDVLVVMKELSFENRMVISGIVVDIMLAMGVLLSVKKFSVLQIGEMKKNRAMFWKTIEPDLVQL